MEKYSFASFAEADGKLNELKAEGFSETQTIENVPVGACIGSLVIEKSGKGKQVVSNPIVTVVGFERTNDKGETLKLAFTAVTMNVLHVSTGKSFNDLLVKATPELREAVSKPENYTKEIMLESAPYTDGQKRSRTILKFESIAK